MSSRGFLSFSKLPNGYPHVVEHAKTFDFMQQLQLFQNYGDELFCNGNRWKGVLKQNHFQEVSFWQLLGSQVFSQRTARVGHQLGGQHPRPHHGVDLGQLLRILVQPTRRVQAALAVAAAAVTVGMGAAVQQLCNGSPNWMSGPTYQSISPGIFFKSGDRGGSPPPGVGVGVGPSGSPPGGGLPEIWRKAPIFFFDNKLPTPCPAPEPWAPQRVGGWARNPSGP